MAKELTPPGDARRDEIKKQADDLQEKLETQGTDGGKINPEVLKLDPEAVHEFQDIHNPMEVSNPQPGFRYKWVYIGWHGRMIQQARFEGREVGGRGWEVVKGEMPEAREYMHEDSTRRVIDTILMRIPVDEYNKIQARREDLQQAREDGATAALEDLAYKHGLTVKKDYLPPGVTREFAQQMAQTKFDQMIRQGTVPGMRVRAR